MFNGRMNTSSLAIGRYLKFKMSVTVEKTKTNFRNKAIYSSHSNKKEAIITASLAVRFSRG